MKSIAALVAIIVVATPFAPAAFAQDNMSLLERFMAQDTNHDGSITREEAIAGRAALFDRADADGDGMITTPERNAAVQRVSENRGMQRADANKDGSISRSEFMSRPYYVFDRFDANHDDTLTPDELAALRARAAQMGIR